ncbi:E4 ubiquitin-protein ligase UFD2-like 8 [Homarus americanus]|uniref:E4 ubiquitin-protein ligase UFD2-like 8 n=1 Tax=Homarus americanus TaxID=6706 RepID=A0A8J5JPQ6_HOMAM|nr:E4 ubiquitin-protein ligase UFD2-like 8 [Homarus americanus]
MVVCFCGEQHNTVVGYSIIGLDYQVHPPPSKSLKYLRDMLYRHSRHDCSQMLQVGEFVYHYAVQWVQVESLCLRHLIVAVELGEDASVWIGNRETMTLMATMKTKLGIEAANAVAVRMMGSMTTVVTDSWEDLMWTIISLIEYWDPSFQEDIKQSLCTKVWVLRLMNCPDVCPNFHLRVQMIRFVEMWSDGYMASLFFGWQAATALVAVSPNLQVDQLLPNSLSSSLVKPFMKVLSSCWEQGHLEPIATAAVHQVKELRVGPELRCLAHLVELARQMATTIKDWYETGCWNGPMTVLLFENVFILLKILVATSPTMEAYESPGLAQAAAAALVSATSSVVSLTSKLLDRRNASFTSLLVEIDGILNLLVSRKTPHSVGALLWRDHGYQLCFLTRQATEGGCPFLKIHKVCGERTESCPKRFLDSVTQAVMEAPVLLHSSKMVVDESTLIHLLLTSPSDPFTRCPLDPDTYSRLPDLHNDIVAWRNNTRGLQGIFNSGSEDETANSIVVGDTSNSDTNSSVVDDTSSSATNDTSPRDC